MSGLVFSPNSFFSSEEQVRDAADNDIAGDPSLQVIPIR
jgi:hypothetical protein